MPRPKKDYILLSMKVDSAVMKRFNEYCQEVGQTKTLAFERIISSHIDQYENEKKALDELKKEHVVSK